MRRGVPIRYKRNPPLLGKVNNGMKVMDKLTTFWTYEDYLGLNEFGELVDVRGQGMDIREDGPGEP